MKITKHDILGLLISIFLNGLAAYILDVGFVKFVVSALLILLAVKIQEALTEQK